MIGYFCSLLSKKVNRKIVIKKVSFNSTGHLFMTSFTLHAFYPFHSKLSSIKTINQVNKIGTEP